MFATLKGAITMPEDGTTSPTRIIPCSGRRVKRLREAEHGPMRPGGLAL